MMFVYTHRTVQKFGVSKFYFIYLLFDYFYLFYLFIFSKKK